MKKQLIVLMLMLIVVLIASVFGMRYVMRSIEPRWEDNLFVQACAKLNGQKFSFESINTLRGQCYENCTETGCTKVTLCSNKHIQEALSSPNFPFVVSSHGVDQSWQCRIESINPTIKAVPFYNYE